MLKFNIGDSVVLNPNLNTFDCAEDYRHVLTHKLIGVVKEIHPKFIEGNIEILWPYNVYFPDASENLNDLFPCFSWELSHA